VGESVLDALWGDITDLGRALAGRARAASGGYVLEEGETDSSKMAGIGLDLAGLLAGFGPAGAARGSLGSGLVLPPAANAARTQIPGTLPTYRKAAEILRAHGVGDPRLDYGAGLGLGAKEIGAHTFEPFARGWKPTYTDPRHIPSEAYGGVTNLNVLNVVPKDVRDDIVENIGRVLAPGGRGIITARGRDVLSAGGRPGPEPMSVLTSRDTYQKGFTPRELNEYLSHVLGSRFEVAPLRLGPAGAMILKK
jgi:hypothetical protein